MPDVFVAKDITKEPHHHDYRHEHKGKLFDLSHTREFTGSVEGLKGHNHNPLSSFCYYPHNVNFVNKEPDEEVVLLVRRHIITNIPWFLVSVAMAITPTIVGGLSVLDFLPVRFQVAISLIWYLLSLAVFIEGFLSWFFSVNIITNKRVIDVDFINLIYREISDAEVTHIEDVTVQMGSVVRTLFNYGDLEIQTAAETKQIEFMAIPHPDRVQRILSDLRMGDER